MVLSGLGSAASGAVAATPAPPVSAPSALVLEASTGDVAYAKQPDRRRAIASTTKLMTALLVLEQTKGSTVFRGARYRALPVESKIDLRAGERMSVADLLRALLIESANDAAVTLAEGVSGSRSAFVAEMNKRAQELGLKNTHYSNPIGLDTAGNYSTARDLARLTLRLRRWLPQRRQLCRTLREKFAPEFLQRGKAAFHLSHCRGSALSHLRRPRL